MIEGKKKKKKRDDYAWLINERDGFMGSTGVPEGLLRLV